MTEDQLELAETVGISTSYLSQIETSKRKGTTELLLSVAKALNVTFDDIVFQSDKYFGSIEYSKKAS